MAKRTRRGANVRWIVRVSGLGLALAAASASGCKTENPNAPEEGGAGGANPTGGTTTGGTATSGTTAGGANTGGIAGGAAGTPAAGAGGGAGVGGSANTGGSPSGGAPSGGNTTGGVGGAAAVCGNARLEAPEECDGSVPTGTTCESLGFEGGTLSCVECKLERKACTGTERCFDDRDNDGDEKVDCDDSDCATDCASSCTVTPTIPDPGVVTGSTRGHASSLDASCSSGPGTTGREVVHRFVAARDGVLEADLVSGSADLTLSLRRHCAAAGSELTCGDGVLVSTLVKRDDVLFVVVDGATATDAGSYRLEMATRAVVCGDRRRDLGEECDDGNTTPGDGCSATCALDATETEPNDSNPDPWVSPFFGAISPSGDVDLIQITVPSSGGRIVAYTQDLGDGACGAGAQDSALEIRDATNVVLASNDDDVTLCARVEATGLAAGDYTVRVAASPDGDTPVFPYRLVITVE